MFFLSFSFPCLSLSLLCLSLTFFSPLFSICSLFILIHFSSFIPLWIFFHFTPSLVHLLIPFANTCHVFFILSLSFSLSLSLSFSQSLSLSLLFFLFPPSVFLDLLYALTPLSHLNFFTWVFSLEYFFWEKKREKRIFFLFLHPFFCCKRRWWYLSRRVEGLNTWNWSSSASSSFFLPISLSHSLWKKRWRGKKREEEKKEKRERNMRKK